MVFPQGSHPIAIFPPLFSCFFFIMNPLDLDASHRPLGLKSDQHTSLSGDSPCCVACWLSPLTYSIKNFYFLFAEVVVLTLFCICIFFFSFIILWSILVISMIYQDNKDYSLSISHIIFLGNMHSVQ